LKSYARGENNREGKENRGGSLKGEKSSSVWDITLSVDGGGSKREEGGMRDITKGTNSREIKPKFCWVGFRGGMQIGIKKKKILFR